VAGGCDSGYSCAYTRNISWSDGMTPVPKICDPLVAFNNLFMGFDPKASQADLAKRKLYNKSVLDYVTKDAQSLAVKLGKGDAVRLDQYLSGVRELELQVTQTLQAVLQRDETPLTIADRSRVAQEVADEILGHGPLEPYLRDPGISEIMVNGHDQIYVERDGRLYPVAAAFMDENHLRRVIDKIVARVGRRVDESSPMVDARLPDGSRVNAVVPPIALDGSRGNARRILHRDRSRHERMDGALNGAAME